MNHTRTACGRMAAAGWALLLTTLGALPRDDRGQSTAEYALVLLGAATIAMVFVAWAGGTSRIGSLLDGVFDSVITRIQ